MSCSCSPAKIFSANFVLGAFCDEGQKSETPWAAAARREEERQEGRKGEILLFVYFLSSRKK